MESQKNRLSTMLREYGPDVLKATVAALVFVASVAFAAGQISRDAQSVQPRIIALEQEQAAIKRDNAVFQQTSITNQAVVISRLDALSAQMTEVQRVLMTQRR